MKDRTRFSYPDLNLKVWSCMQLLHISLSVVLWVSYYTQCRTTMARIKQVLNERRIAYLGAAKLLEQGGPTPKPDAAGAPLITRGSRESEGSTDAQSVAAVNLGAMGLS
jgi:hypothetical protein